jgi:hypothetical protein
MATTNKYGVVSFETAQRLREAGVRVKTAFCYDTDGELWVQDNDPNDSTEDDLGIICLSDRNTKYAINWNTLPAPAFEDILKILPKSVEYEGDQYALTFDFANGWVNYYIGCYDCPLLVGEGQEWIYADIAGGMAEGAAELLLLLKKHNLLDGK